MTNTPESSGSNYGRPERPSGSESIIYDMPLTHLSGVQLGVAEHVQSSWHFSSADPLVLSASIESASGPAHWAIGRDLIADAMFKPDVTVVGESDVRFVRDLNPALHHMYLHMVLSVESDTADSPLSSNTADLLIPVDYMADFLRQTGHVVPFGQELQQYDFDSELSKMLAEDGGDMPPTDPA